MKNLIKIILFGVTILLNSANANKEVNECIEFSDQEVFIPSRLGNIKLYKDNKGFYIIKDNKVYNVQNCFCDSLLRKMSNKQLIEFLGRNNPKLILVTDEEFEQIIDDNLSNDLVIIDNKNKEDLLEKLFSSGYISVNQMSDGEYVLRANVRLLGGAFWDTLKKIAKVIVIISVGIAIVGLVVMATSNTSYSRGERSAGATYGFVGGAIVGISIAAYTTEHESKDTNNNEEEDDIGLEQKPTKQMLLYNVPFRIPKFRELPVQTDQYLHNMYLI